MILIIETLLKSYIKSLCAVKSLLNVTFLKRFFGVIIILSMLLVNSEWIVYGYILSSFIGMLFNAYLYSNLIGISIFSLFLTILKVAVPSFLSFILIVLAQYFVDNDFMLFILCMLFIGIYYTLLILLLYRKRKVYGQ